MPNHAQTHSNKIATLPILETEKELRKFLEANFTDSLKQLIKVTVNIMIKDEMKTFRKEMTDLVGTLQFNGYYGRNMTSTFGEIKNIPVPRFRENPVDFRPQTLQIFASEQEKFTKLIEQMHLLGISQRKVKTLIKTCFGIRISTTRVGTIHRQLAEAEETQINTQVLDDDFEYLIADGLWTKAKGYGWENNRAVLLCILGIRPNGERKIIGFRVAREESYEQWYTLICSIKKRGLAGKDLKLVIADDTKGLTGAIHQLYPKVSIQLCILHKMRNVFAKTSHKHKANIGEDLKTIYRQKTKKAAISQAKAFCKKWYIKEKAAVASLRHNFELTLTYLEFPRELWVKLRTTNILEREFREVRRKIKDREIHAVDFSTKTHPVFNYYRNLFYKNEQFLIIVIY